MKFSKSIYKFSKTVLFLLLTVTLISCAKDDSPENENDSNFYLTAKIDGVYFTKENVLASVVPDETAFYSIGAVGGDFSIGLTLNSPISVGTFTPAVGETITLFYQEISPYAVWAASEDGGSGTITITENNATYVAGTFSFTGVNPLDNTTKQITEGKFKAKKIQ